MNILDYVHEELEDIIETGVNHQVSLDCDGLSIYINWTDSDGFKVTIWQGGFYTERFYWFPYEVVRFLRRNYKEITRE